MGFVIDSPPNTPPRDWLRHQRGEPRHERVLDDLAVASLVKRASDLDGSCFVVPPSIVEAYNREWGLTPYPKQANPSDGPAEFRHYRDIELQNREDLFGKLGVFAAHMEEEVTQPIVASDWSELSDFWQRQKEAARQARLSTPYGVMTFRP